ncbi:hypothetical protein PENNAL_c0277G03819 [Penicillium nalgiovense]|uniref:Uncharacterized protein n=1 Tax=Penicillium nalgiovense TaxID=60175 RepID=A0A1V6WG22_PENNA|nr:hypothetical protein PENNAL_c0277G03819 [Penicillium nalgiovense]
MKAGMDFASLVFLLFAVLVVTRPNNEPVEKATSTNLVRSPKSASEKRNC